jgi:hypothetical protein
MKIILGFMAFAVVAVAAVLILKTFRGEHPGEHPAAT